MAFTQIEKKRPLGRPGERVTGVRLSKSEKQGCMQISISGIVAAQVPLVVGDYISIAIGSGGDAGWIAIQKNATGFKLGRDGDKTTTLKAGCAALLRHVKRLPITPCKYAITGNTLLVQIPESLLALSDQ